MALSDDGLEDLLEEEFDASSYAPTTTINETSRRAEAFAAHVVPPPPPPPVDIGAPPPYNPQWFPSHPTSGTSKNELGPSVSPVTNIPMAPNLKKTSNINASSRPPRPMRPPPLSANSASTPNHTFRALTSSEQNGGGSGDDDGGPGNGNDKDVNLLPQAPTAKVLTPEERAKLEQDDQKRLEVQSIQKTRQMQQEAARKSEERLYHLRLQHEDEQIAQRRIEDYHRRRKRQQALAKECARRMTYPPATHESRMPPADDEAVARELSSLQFKDGWRSVFAAFGVGGPEDFIKSVRADEEFNSYIASTSVRLVDAELVRDFMRMVLEGAPAGLHVRRVVVSPPEQYDPDPAQRVSLFSLGRCLRAVPVVFTSLLSHQWDLLSDARRGNLTEQDWVRLLNTAKAHVSSLLGLSLGALRMKYPLLMSPQSRIKQDPEIETRLFVRECLQQALVGLFDRGLGLFYYQVFAEKDKKLQHVAKRFHGKGLVEVAVHLGLNPNSSVAKQLTTNPEMEVGMTHAVRNALEIICAPSLRLSLFVDCSRALGSLGVSGDEFLPLFCAGLVLGMDTSSKPIKLASLANIMDDFALAEDFRHGESGYVCSTVLTAVEVLLDEFDRVSLGRFSSSSSSVVNKNKLSEEQMLKETEAKTRISSLDKGFTSTLQDETIQEDVVNETFELGTESNPSDVPRMKVEIEDAQADESNTLNSNNNATQASHLKFRNQFIDLDAGTNIISRNLGDSSPNEMNIALGTAAMAGNNSFLLSTDEMERGSRVRNEDNDNVITNQESIQSSSEMIMENIHTELNLELSSSTAQVDSFPNNNKGMLDDEDNVTFLVLKNGKESSMSLGNRDEFDKVSLHGSVDKETEPLVETEEVVKGREQRLPSLDADVAKVKSILSQLNLNNEMHMENVKPFNEDDETSLKEEEERLLPFLERITTTSDASMSKMVFDSNVHVGFNVSKRRWDESEQTTTNDDSQRTNNLDTNEETIVPSIINKKQNASFPNAIDSEQEERPLLAFNEEDEPQPRFGLETVEEEDVNFEKDNQQPQPEVQNKSEKISLDQLNSPLHQ